MELVFRLIPIIKKENTSKSDFLSPKRMTIFMLCCMLFMNTLFICINRKNM